MDGKSEAPDVADRKYIQPGSGTRKLNNLLARVGAPAVAVMGRRSGEMRLTAIIPVTVDGKKYLVSTRGDSDWVRNLRTAGRGELRQAFTKRPFTVVEVDGVEKERAVADYCRKVGTEVKRYFDQLPDLKDHPTFRLEF